MANEPFELTFELEKDTKNTYQYKETTVEAGKPPVIGTVYVQKWALGSPAPEKIQISLMVA